MKVTNINGTSDNICKCGNWLQHWINNSDSTLPTYCPEEKCTNKPEVGAHVQKVDSYDKNWYIVPLCKTHNGKTYETITIGDYIKLVSANVSETCGKSRY